MLARTTAALAGVVLLTGCGAHDTTIVRGRHVFQSRCAGCHSADGREHRTDGGDLAAGRLSQRDLVSFTRVMPVRPALDRADTTAVAAYLYSRERTVGGLSSSP